MAEGQNIHEDIRWLETQLEAKKKELSDKSGESKEDREVVREILRDTQSEEPLLPPPTNQTISDDDAKKKAGELEERKHHEVIEELINIAFSKDLASALKVAESFKNPHIMDEFHDTLADQYYQKLIDARKLK